MTTMSRFSCTLLSLSLIAGCNSPADDAAPEAEKPIGTFKTNGAIVVADLDEFHDEGTTPDGHAYLQNAFTGHIIGAGKNELDLDWKLKGASWTLFKPAKAGDDPNKDNIVLQYVIADVTDSAGDIFILLSEFAPGSGDENPRMWLSNGTGKYRGTTMAGNWYFDWPEGVEAPAEHSTRISMTFNFTSNDNIVGEGIKTNSLGLKALGGGEIYSFEGVQLFRDPPPPDMFMQKPIVDGLSLNRHVSDTKLVLIDKNNPLEGAIVYGLSWVLYDPETFDGGPNRDNMISQTGCSFLKDKDGDVIIAVYEFVPLYGHTAGNASIFFGTGKYEGARGLERWAWHKFDHVDLLDDAGEYGGQTTIDGYLEMPGNAE